MNTIFKTLNTVITFVLLCIGLSANAQLGFCTGNSGDPIFVETFGTGATNGPTLPAGVTSYTYVNGLPADGSYTISSRTNYYDWFNTKDHTPGDSRGKAFIVNASFSPGEFFRRTIDGLCENTSYEFSSWLINLLPSRGCGGNGIPINVRFQIWDETNTNILATGDTGDIFSKSSAVWEKYGLVFQTEPGQTSVILKMINNGVGGCGNDLAIDDIVFKTCGDFISLAQSTGEKIIANCEDDGAIVSTTITATPDFSIYDSHAYQWQESLDSSNWVDIPGENAATYTTPTLTDSRFFRVKVAEDEINVSNPLCNVVSDVFSALIIPIPSAPTSNGNVTTCANNLIPLQVTVPDNQIVNWYDSPTGGNLLQENSTSFTPQTSGTFYAAASSNLTDCFSLTRTALTYTINKIPILTDESVILCENVPLTLMAGLPNVSYAWSTGENTASIEISQPGMYTMTATDGNGCSATKTITVTQIDQPIIDTIISDDEDIIVKILNEGDFEYALDNGLYQDSPVFELVAGGSYTVYVRVKNSCPSISQEFLHFVVPKFFTPNGDNFNDLFILQGLKFFTAVNVQIFTRYGALIKQSSETSFSWDGTLNGQRLPASDYWYLIQADNQQFKGHFSLKR